MEWCLLSLRKQYVSFSIFYQSISWSSKPEPIVGNLSCSLDLIPTYWVFNYVTSCLLTSSRRQQSKHLHLHFFTFFHIHTAIFILYLFYFLIFGCAGSLLLHRLSSGCGEWRFLSRCGVQASHCSGFSCGAQAPGHAGFGSCSSWALEHRLNNCGARA